MKPFTPSEKQILAAKKIINAPKRKIEGHIRQDILRLLDLMEVECIADYPTDDGPADIYLPRRRLFIEIKASGYADDPNEPQSRKNNESPKEQLERYVFSEIAREKGMLDLDGSYERRWVGVLTDGHNWHAWLYDHHSEAIARPEFSSLRPTSPEELIQKIVNLIADGPLGKPWIPADPKSVFEYDLQQLHDIYETLPKNQVVSLDTKIKLWLERLRTACMEPENESRKHRLFVQHTFLVCLARGIVYTLSNPHETPKCKDVYSDGFIAWVTDTTKGQAWGDALLGRIDGYEWRRRRGDVLRALYEQLIDAVDRKIFGEYYAPDWLAEWLVEEVLDDEWCEEAVKATLVAEQNQQELQGVGVLDPTCGSGTFLYYAVKRILRTPGLAGLSLTHKSTIVAKLVNGIDVHPVAAEISRATILRALPAMPFNEQSGIRVYEGDALLTTQYEEGSLFYPTHGEVKITTPKGAIVILPKSFVDDPSFKDNLRRMVICATNQQELPIDILISVSEEDRELMNQCHQRFIEIICDEGNSVWTWFISNTAGPYRLAQQKVNRIVANPPWVRMADIQFQNRKRALEQFAKTKLRIWTGGKQAPHFDIAQLFIKRSRQLYLDNQANDPAVWIVKKSALRAGNWRLFRDWHKNYLAQTLDLDEVKVFGGGDARRCCVLFDIRKGTVLYPTESPRVMGHCVGKRPDTQMSLKEAHKLLSFEDINVEMPRVPSDYLDQDRHPVFRQGATVTPSVLLIVRESKSAHDEQIVVTTEKSNKKPWNSIHSQKGKIPKHWLRDIVKSQQLLPFAVLEQLPSAIIPTDLNGDLLTAPAFDNQFWEKLDEIYQEHAGIGNNTPKTLLTRLNFSKGVRSQLRNNSLKRELGGRRMVLYPRSGDIMRAARYSITKAVIDCSLYRWIAESEDEAAYLVAILNAPCLSYAFKEARSSGRDFHQHPWRAIPIKRYSRKNPTHQKIRDICVEAENLAKSLLETPKGSSLGQVAKSSRIRAQLTDCGHFHKLDQFVKRILPDHTV